MNQQIEIRKYREEDLEVLKTITAICFDGVSIDADVSANCDGVLVACCDAEPIGYITTRIDVEAKVGGIPNYAVLPAFQKRGIGKRLIEAALDYLRKAGMECVRIETLDQNEVGKHFYPKLGFELIATQHHYAMRL